MRSWVCRCRCRGEVRACHFPGAGGLIPLAVMAAMGAAVPAWALQRTGAGQMGPRCAGPRELSGVRWVNSGAE
jgi:hypothetical protein